MNERASRRPIDEACDYVPHRGRPEWEIQAMPDADREIVRQAERYSMTGVARLHALVIAVRYVVNSRIPGALAECGVWRGGSVLAMVLALQQHGVSDRDVYLFDTFAGMTEPTARDTSPISGSALRFWAGNPLPPGERFEFPSHLVSENAVREVVLSSGYPSDRVRLVPGSVEETLPAHAPPGLALLRLDTDWYESTRHELLHLYPRLAKGAVLIIDDYGHWDGCRAAVDEFFATLAQPPLLARVDYDCRIAVKRD